MRGSDADAVASRLAATTTTHFEGFPAAGLPSLRDLARNNERAWFLERKDVYHERVEEPMRALIGEVAAGCTAAKLGFAPNPSQPMFRIYRGVRFSTRKAWLRARYRRHPHPASARIRRPSRDAKGALP